MSSIELQLCLTIGQLILQHGIPAAMQIVKDWETTDPTIEDIKALGDMKPAASYFGG